MSIWNRAWNRLCCWGYGWQAHGDAFVHMLRGHRVAWFGDCVDLWTGHLGCISCEACPDSRVENGKHVGAILWARDNAAIWWLGRFICRWLGHDELRHPQTWHCGFMAYLHDKWYCYRCLEDIESPQAENAVAPSAK